MTNHGIEFAGEQKKKRYKRKQKNKKRKKKDGFERNGVSDFIEEREKKDGGYDEPWNRIY